MCKAKMFAAWLRMDTSATYEKLVKALAAVGKRNIAKSMCAARGMSQHWNVHLYTIVYIHSVVGLGEDT